jgi:ectoine hydroxylase-related dioxygenase (phytanoyl-CoA dioxygenase family)
LIEAAMPKSLSQAQIDRYNSDGFAFPAPALTSGEVSAMRADLESWEAKQGHPLDFPEKSKSYLLYGWADAIVHHPRVLDAVEDVLGPDILVYHSTMWIKEAHTPAYVRWHQDGAYFFLDPLEHVTAWVALSDASELAGCMRVVPGTHRLPMLEHDDKPDALNMIKRGQGISDRFDGETGVSMPLRAGDLSLHHTALVHCSPGNESADRRMGLGVSFVPAHVRPLGPVQPSALLVRGVDRFNHYTREERLKVPMSQEAQAAHAEAVRRFRLRQDQGFAKAAE